MAARINCLPWCRPGNTAEERRIIKRILRKYAYRDLSWLDWVTIVLTAAYPGKPLSNTDITPARPLPIAGSLLGSAADTWHIKHATIVKA